MGKITILLIVLLIAKQTKAVSYNQPKFCSMVSWKPHAETFADSTTIGQQPYSIFVNDNNTVYVAAQSHGMIKMWVEGNILQASNVSERLLYPFNVFVTSNNDIYAYSIYDNHSGNGVTPSGSISGSTATPNQGSKEVYCCDFWLFFCWWSQRCSPHDNQSGTSTILPQNQSHNNSNAIRKGGHGSVCKWSLNITDTEIVMDVDGTCFGLFVDTNDSIYCSMIDRHQVMKKSLNVKENITIVAGTGANGSASNMLSSPWGIFVSIEFDLYVADYSNHRIQCFQLGNLNGITVVGDTVSGTTDLTYPTGVILDGDGYLFVVDSGNHRIVGSGPNGFRCVAGCSEIGGSADNQLLRPTTLSFDSYGNMFVVDTGNNRIQKFLFASNSCDLSYNKPKFCSSVSWNPNATTFANKTTVGEKVSGLFVDASNTIYVANQKGTHGHQEAAT